MDVRVHGKRMQVSNDLREMAEEKVAHAGRFFEAVDGADVEVSESQNPRIADGRYRVEITTTVAGQLVRVEASAPDDRSALDRAVDKYERRLRKLKERLVQRSRKSNKPLNEPEPSVEELGSAAPQIMRTKRFAMKPMMPEEAALQMEMLGHDFFFFMNGDTGTYCVLYHRRDGTLGLIEPA